MNERNIAALAALIREMDGDHRLGAGALAEALASRGCLVPAALTEDQANYFVFHAITEWDDPTVAVDSRAYLERIAKGETA